MLRVCTILVLTMRASGDATSEAEAQALVKLTHLFKKDPSAAEQLVRAAKGSAPAPAPRVPSTPACSIVSAEPSPRRASPPSSTV